MLRHIRVILLATNTNRLHITRAYTQKSNSLTRHDSKTISDIYYIPIFTFEITLKVIYLWHTKTAMHSNRKRICVVKSRNYEYDYPYNSKGHHPIKLAGTAFQIFFVRIEIEYLSGQYIPEQFLCRGNTISRYLGGPLHKILANTVPTLPLLLREVACSI